MAHRVGEEEVQCYRALEDERGRETQLKKEKGATSKMEAAAAAKAAHKKEEQCKKKKKEEARDCEAQEAKAQEEKKRKQLERKIKDAEFQAMARKKLASIVWLEKYKVDHPV